MKTVAYSLLTLIMLGAAVFGWHYAKHRDERQIRRTLGVMSGLIAKSGDESDLVRFAKISRFVGFFADDARIAVGSPAPEASGREDLKMVLVNGQRLFSRLEVVPVDVSLAIAPDHRTAVTEFTLKITGRPIGESKPYVDAREVSVSWKKIDRNWLISEVRPLKTLY